MRYACMHNCTGKSDKRAGCKIAKAEAALGRFGLHLSSVVNSNLPWELSSNDIKLAQKRLKSIHIPEHLDFHAMWLFSHPTRLKSHDWKQVLQNTISSDQF